MGKSYDIPVITVDVKGGVIQKIHIPFDEPKIKVILRDYDAQEEGYQTKYDENDALYDEGIWEN